MPYNMRTHVYEDSLEQIPSLFCKWGITVLFKQKICYPFVSVKVCLIDV